MDRREYLKKKNQERKKTHTRFELSIPNSQAQPFKSLAKKEGVSANTLILRFAQAYLDESYIVPKRLKKRLDEHNFLIRNVANNVNQIAHSSNIFNTAEKQAVLKNLEELNELVHNLVTELSQA